MASPLYFPRMPGLAARKLLAEYTNMKIEDLRSRAELESDQAYYYPTAPSGQRVPTSVLDEFQNTMREVAKNFGYPEKLSPKDRRRTEWDRVVVEHILQVTPLIPAEASVQSVWSYLSLVVVPDVAFWRWPNRGNKDDYERILGYPRNVFRRLWWRAFALGPVAAEIFEDEAVAILERTAIGGNRKVARIIAETHLRELGDEGRRTLLMRDAMKRLRRLHAFISFHSLQEGEIRALVEEVFSSARSSLRIKVAG